MSGRREEKALLEFKQVVKNIVQLLRKSMEADTTYIYWVNRIRKQFVLETSATILSNVMFRDRIEFDDFFLNEYRNLTEVTQLKVGEGVNQEELSHYHDVVPARFVTLIPFINNGETVALTVVESEHQPNLSDFGDVLSSFQSALRNVLNTYLEVTDLYEHQKQWSDYDVSLDQISPRMHRTEILDVMIAEMQKLLPEGGVSIAARGMGTWVTVMQSSGALNCPETGALIEEKSMAYDALEKGEPQFSIHFNQNPKRISSAEEHVEGATLAIPLLINDRRHAVVLACAPNPLVFKESTKHKLVNLVRLAALAIQVNLGKTEPEQNLLTSAHGSFIPEVWEKSLGRKIRSASGSERTTWFGFVTVENLAELRASLRLEELMQLQRTLVSMMNPARHGFLGYIGFNTDYIYAFLLSGEQVKVYQDWFDTIDRLLDQPVELTNGKRVNVQVKIGSVTVHDQYKDVHEVVTAAKKALSEVVKSEVKSVINF
jgi:hypothetical protein